MNYRNTFFKLTGATILAQLISFIFLPIISRLYSPTDFADFAYWTTLGAMLGGLLTLKQEQFLLSRPVVEWAPILQRIYAIYQYACFAFIIFSCAFIFIHGFENIIELSLIFSYCLSTSLIILSSTIANIHNKFSELSNARVFMSITLVCAQAALGLFFANSASLLAGSVTSQLVFLAIVYPAIRQLKLGTSVSTPTLPSSEDIRKSISSILSTISLVVATNFLPVMLFTLGYRHEAGVVAMLQRFLMFPVNLIAPPLYQLLVSFLKANEAAELNKQQLNITIFLVASAYTISYIATKLAGHFSFFEIVLGDVWSTADAIAPTIVSIYTGLLIRNILPPYFLVKEKQTLLARLDLLFIALLAICYVFTWSGYLDFSNFLISLNLAYLSFALLPLLFIIITNKSENRYSKFK